jgi:hypothetical protein
MPHRTRAFVALLLLGSLAGCQGSTAPLHVMEPPFVISPGGGTIVKCNTYQLQVQDAAGVWVTLDSTNWSSSDSVAAPVSVRGSVRALHSSPGVTIGAIVKYNEIQGSAQTVFAIVEQFSGSCVP